MIMRLKIQYLSNLSDQASDTGTMRSHCHLPVGGKDRQMWRSTVFAPHCQERRRCSSWRSRKYAILQKHGVPNQRRPASCGSNTAGAQHRRRSTVACASPEVRAYLPVLPCLLLLEYRDSLAYSIFNVPSRLVNHQDIGSREGAEGPKLPIAEMLSFPSVS